MVQQKKVIESAWDKYHNKGEKQKTAKYYATNQNVLREDARTKHRNLSEKEKNNIGNIKGNTDY